MDNCYNCIYSLTDLDGTRYCKHRRIISTIEEEVDTRACENYHNNGGDSYILAIDPGNVESAFVLASTADLKPVKIGKVENKKLQRIIVEEILPSYPELITAIEMVASYGMPVGATVFETCVWIGRFLELVESFKIPTQKIYRKSDVCTNICHSTRAKDSNIRRALIDRFAKHDHKNGRGTKKNPDWFYGFAADIWQAYAVLVTFVDKYYKYER